MLEKNFLNHISWKYLSHSVVQLFVIGFFHWFVNFYTARKNKRSTLVQMKEWVKFEPGILPQIIQKLYERRKEIKGAGLAIGSFGCGGSSLR